MEAALPPPSMAGAPRALFIQNHCAKSGELGFSERTPEACTNLSCGRFVLCWERNGDRSIGGANLRKGLAPSMEAALPPPCLAGAPCALFIQNHCAKSGNWGFSERTPEACTNLTCGRFVFCWEWGGDRSIGGANLRKGQCPFNGSGTAAPRPPRTICCFAGLQKGRVRPAKGAPVF